MSKVKNGYEFNPEDYIVYPSHGVGQIVAIDKHEVAGVEMEMFVISFEKDKMTLRIPIDKAVSIGFAFAKFAAVKAAIATGGVIIDIKPK